MLHSRELRDFPCALLIKEDPLGMDDYGLSIIEEPIKALMGMIQKTILVGSSLADVHGLE